MTAHKKPRITKMLLNFIFVIPSFFSLFSKITTLIGIEARIAGKSLVTILIFSIFFVILLTTTWLGLLAILFVYLVSTLHWGIELSLLAILTFNVILLLVIGLAIDKLKKNLFFPATSKQLMALRKIYED